MFRRLLLAALCTTLPIAAAAADVTLAGSDLLRPALERSLAGRTLEDGRTIRVALAGSRIGLEDLRARRADVVVATFAPDEPLPDKEFQLFPFAYQIVVFAVNRNNPVRSATLPQLGGIYGDREPLNLRQWGDLGAKGMWAARRIALNCVDAPESIGLDLFRAVAMNNPQLRSTIVELPDTDELLRKLRVDDNCIGLFLEPIPEEAGVSVLLVARTAKDVPFGPTPGNVHAGDYPLRLPFYLAVARERTAELRSTLLLLVGDETASLLEKAGFVAVPANARNEIRRTIRQ